MNILHSHNFHQAHFFVFLDADHARVRVPCKRAVNKVEAENANLRDNLATGNNMLLGRNEFCKMITSCPV